MVGLGAPQILGAIREPAYAIQFCLVLSTDTDTGCVTVKYQHTPGGTADLYLYPGQTPQRQGTLVQREAYTGQYQIGFEYPCFYKGGNESVATLTPPHGFDDLYLSLLLAIGLLAIAAFNIHMAVRVPTSTAVLMPTRTAPPAVTPSPVGASVVAVPTATQPISNNAAEALRQTDANLKKRIIALAIKLENERDARMELDQRVSQTLEIVSASKYQQSPLRRVSRANAVQPFSRPTEDV
ncbi:TPA: hypothetical protein ACH3X3_002857 [Trebouxia sp. C0006]